MKSSLLWLSEKICILNEHNWSTRVRRTRRAATSSCCVCWMITWLMYIKFIFNLIILLTRVLLFFSSCRTQTVSKHSYIQQQPQMLQKQAAPSPGKMEALAWKYCRLLAVGREKKFYHYIPLTAIKITKNKKLLCRVSETTAILLHFGVVVRTQLIFVVYAVKWTISVASECEHHIKHCTWHSFFQQSAYFSTTITCPYRE